MKVEGILLEKRKGICESEKKIGKVDLRYDQGVLYGLWTWKNEALCSNNMH